MRTVGKAGRALYLSGYALMTVAGFFIPIELSYFHPQWPFLWWMMSGWLALGGLCSFWGQLSRRWPGEFIGLPLISSSLIGFGLLQASLDEWQVVVIPSVALLWALASLCINRWKDVFKLYKAARGIR